MSSYSQKYRIELFDSVIPFWERHSPDHRHGGFFSCLDREGKVYDTDKFIWLQARQVWTFATLYNTVEQKDTWLDIAMHGARFLEKHGRNPNGDWYFSLNQKGRPLVQPYNIFSDCFAAMAFGALYQATADVAHRELAVTTFMNILSRRKNPKGDYNKQITGTRDLHNFTLPMILSNLALELEPLLDQSLVKELTDDVVHQIMNQFYQPDLGLVLENVLSDGSRSDCFEGRVVNPGHGLEAMWFLMDLAERKSDPKLLNKTIRISLDILDYGWDQEYGGIFYFLDHQRKPPQQLEWDQKLWWVHLEALTGLAKGYNLSGNKELAAWFTKVHDYTWSLFPDPQHGEWFGYMRRDGSRLLESKGGKWKGCFHVPRALLKISEAFKAIEDHQPIIEKPGNL